MPATNNTTARLVGTDVLIRKGQTWTNTGSDANVWEPGVFGWTVAR